MRPWVRIGGQRRRGQDTSPDISRGTRLRSLFFPFRSLRTCDFYRYHLFLFIFLLFFTYLSIDLSIYLSTPFCLVSISDVACGVIIHHADILWEGKEREGVKGWMDGWSSVEDMDLFIFFL